MQRTQVARFVALITATASVGPSLRHAAAEPLTFPIVPLPPISLIQQPPADAPNEVDERLAISADRVSSWTRDKTNILLLRGPVRIDTGSATLSADDAVVYLSPTDLDGVLHAEIALIGRARAKMDGAERTGGRLMVDLLVRRDVSVDATDLKPEVAEADPIFQSATALRDDAGADAIAGTRPDAGSTQPVATGAPTTAQTVRNTPAVVPGSPVPVTLKFGKATSTKTETGKVALALEDGVVLIARRPNGDLVELQSKSAVVYTTLDDLGQAIGGEGQSTQESVESVYLEGDVRVNFTPTDTTRPEQRLLADRAFYSFVSDRAILTDAVLHTSAPQYGLPLTVRAATIRRVAADEYRAEHANISNSTFARPALSLGARRVYVRQEQTGDERLGTRTVFSGRDVTLRAGNVPFFWLPGIGGSVTEAGFPLRALGFGNNRSFGFGIETEWGLFETLGVAPPAGVDASYKVDYYSDRGPGFGIDFDYRRSSVDPNTRGVESYEGNFTGYITHDSGEDRLGRDRRRIDNDRVRGRALWEHQQFFDDEWQLQVRAGYVSDGTFLEEWFERDFDTGLPYEGSIYVKRSKGTEAFTLLGTYDWNDLVTSSNELQENANIERLPELGYYRLGDDLGERATFYSANTVSGLRFSPSRNSLDDIGFRNIGGTPDDESFPGIPSYGYTGIDDDYVGRGDFRQELDFPFALGEVKVVPYIFGRYTGYTDSVNGGAENRLMAGTGVRASTVFWSVNDGIESRLFDIHRVRHLVEPQVHLFTSVQNVDRNDLFIYDEGIDGVSDISAAQFAVRQTWQTKRGGPGRWRSVDFLTFNAAATFYANEPDEPTPLTPTANLTDAGAFRGVFFESEPEASIARDTLSADSTWRVTDTTAVLGDVAWNISEETLGTAALGLAVQRDPRLSYFFGVRYIGEVNSTIGSFAMNYDLTTKYSLQFAQSFDLSEGSSRDTNLTVLRRFEQFVMTFSVYFDRLDEEGGFRIGLVPRGLGTDIFGGTSSRR